MHPNEISLLNMPSALMDEAQRLGPAYVQALKIQTERQLSATTVERSTETTATPK